MVKPNVDGLVASYTSDYFAFQAYFKSVNVSPILPPIVFSVVLTRPYRVPTSVLTPPWEGTLRLFCSLYPLLTGFRSTVT